MITSMPLFIAVFFGVTTLLAFLLFRQVLKKYDSQNQKNLATPILVGIEIWLAIQFLLSYTGVYHSRLNALPPRIVVFGILPILFLIIYLFFNNKGRSFIDCLPLKQLTLISIIRIPVEITLFWLFLEKKVPQIMTFEGQNFDIIAGITAIMIYYFCFVINRGNNRLLLAWNILGLILLLNIVVTALLSTPSPIQKLAFDMPNIAMLYFPFCWLPTFIVPLVLFSHLASIRQLNKNKLL